MGIYVSWLQSKACLPETGQFVVPGSGLTTWLSAVI